MFARGSGSPGSDHQSAACSIRTRPC